MSTRLNQAQLHKLLTDAFDIDGINTLTFTLFPDLANNLPTTLRRNAKIEAIIDYAQRQGRIAPLLAYVQQENPHQYKSYLNQQIAAQQSLLANYEDLHHMEQDDDRRNLLLETMEELKRTIGDWQKELVQLRQVEQPTPSPTRQPTTLIANAPYGLDAAIVGREDELQLLDDWFRHDPDHPFLAILGLGGQGKSALTWAWLQQLLAQQTAPPLVIWWSFYETDGTLDKMLGEILRHFGDDPRKFTALRVAVNRITHHLRHTPALLMLDGAERLLRAYSSMGAHHQADALESGLAYGQARQCIHPATEALLKWLVQPQLTQAQTMMTSRLLPVELQGRTGQSLLQGVRRHDLTGLSVAGAMALFQGQGINATRAEVAEVGAPLSYHPLSLRLLAGYAAKDYARPNDLRAAVSQDPAAKLLGKRQHILHRAYNNLPRTAQHLLSRLAALRGGIAWEIVAEVFGGGQRVQADLDLLEQRGLLQRTRSQTPPLAATSIGERSTTTFDLHPIVRRYAYDRLRGSTEIHAQLVVYFEAVPEPTKVETLADLTPTIELYHHLVRAERYDTACVLLQNRLGTPLYFQLGAYQLLIELLRALFPDGETPLPRLSSEDDQAWVLAVLGLSYSNIGRSSAASSLYKQQIAIHEKQNDKRNLAAGLNNLALQQVSLGALQAAEANLRRSITLFQTIENLSEEGDEHAELGLLLGFSGRFPEAYSELDTAFNQSKAEETLTLLRQGHIWLYRAWLGLLQGDSNQNDLNIVSRAAQQARHFAEADAQAYYPVEYDFVRADWMLGCAALAANDLTVAQGHLDNALSRCRAISLVEVEPAILLAHARLARAKQLPQASSLAQEAQTIAKRANQVLDLADIHNFRAQLALDADDHAAARYHAQLARDYAYCDGPPHAYQPALDTANRLLAQLDGSVD